MNATASTLRSGPQLDTRRVAAAAVDVALLAPLAAALYVLVDGVSGAFVGLVAGWALFYFFAFESGDGQTPGKRLTGLRVLRGDGSRADMRTIAVRTALRVVDFAVGLVVMLITGQRRARVGDLAAGTVVVDARAGTSVSVTPATVVAEPEVEDAPAVEEEPVVQDEPAPYVALTDSAWAHVDEPVALDAPDPGTPTVETEPEEDDEPPLFEPVPRPKLSDAPVELDENDPEMWMAAQREQAAADEDVPAEEDQPAAAGPNGDLFIHPDEEDDDRPVF